MLVSYRSDIKISTASNVGGCTLNHEKGQR